MAILQDVMIYLITFNFFHITRSASFLAMDVLDLVNSWVLKTSLKFIRVLVLVLRLLWSCSHHAMQ